MNLKFLFASGMLLSTYAHGFTYEAPFIESLQADSSKLLRCAQDQIVSAVEARARIEWAYRCGHLDREIWEFEFTHVWNRKTRKHEPVEAGHLRYPIFTTKAAPYDVWDVETNTNNLTSCTVPDHVTFYDVCKSGCFERDQEVLFDEGYLPIGHAVDSLKPSHIVTLDREATFEDLRTTTQNVGYFIASEQDAHMKLLKFTTNDGSITITKGHPLVSASGHIQNADSFKIGDALITEKGDLSPIKSVQEVDYFGKVYNVSPKSELAEENIIVAQKFLNGSHRFQDGGLKNYSDIVLRRQTSSDLIP